jgi:hypothetical protein
MSLGNLFDYWKEFSPTEHLFQFKTILGEEKDKNQFGKFIKTTFKKGEKITDFTEIKKAMELIDSKIKAIEAYAQERNAQAEEYVSGDSAKGSRPKSMPLDEIRESLELVHEGENEARLPVIEADDEIDVSKIEF